MNHAENRTSTEPPALPEAIRERDVLLGLSYRLLGSVADAEDCVQETYSAGTGSPKQNDAKWRLRGGGSSGRPAGSGSTC